MSSSIFLSHTHTDRPIVQQLYHELRKAEVHCWLDEAEILPGESIMGKVEEAIDDMDYLGVILSKTSVNSSWVQAELRMAMTDELKEARVRVIGLVIDDCRIPGFLRDKLYVDLRTDFMAGVKRLVSFLRGEPKVIQKPRQALLAELVEGADEELWHRYTRKGLQRSGFAQLVWSMNDDELTAAVAVAYRWKGYKAWEDWLIRSIVEYTKSDPMTARRILRRLVDLGLLEPATDLDYSRSAQNAYTDGEALYSLRRFAVRSRTFDFLPLPPPERLSEALTTSEPCKSGRAAGMLSTLANRCRVRATLVTSRLSCSSMNQSGHGSLPRPTTGHRRSWTSGKAALSGPKTRSPIPVDWSRLALRLIASTTSGCCDDASVESVCRPGLAPRRL